MKLGSGRVDHGAESLVRFAGTVDRERCGEPSVLGVVVEGGLGYTRDDGVQVIRVGALGP